MMFRHKIIILSLWLCAFMLTSVDVLADTAPPVGQLVVDGPVYAIAVHKDTLYIGGDFSTVNGALFNSIAAINLDSMAPLDTWNPNVDDGSPIVVHDLLVDAVGGRLYVGGTFSMFGTKPRDGLAAVALTTGIIQDWDPSQGVASSITVNDIALSADGRTVYVGGDFTSIAGQPRSHLAAMKVSDGLLTPWAPDPDAVVRSVLLSDSGSHLYVGGDFDFIGGQNRSRLAKLKLTSGDALAWDAGVVGTTVNDLLISDASLYLAGDFSMVDGQARSHAAALDVTSDTPSFLPWNPDLSDPAVALTLAKNNLRMFIGGEFTAVDVGNTNVTRMYLTMTDVDAGLVQPWLPASGAAVTALLSNPDKQSLYVGSSFYTGVDLTSFGSLNMIVPLTSSDPVAGSYQFAQTVSLSCLDHLDAACSSIYYSVDGSEPSLSYSVPLSVNVTTTIRYYGVDAEGVREVIREARFAIDNAPPTSSVSLVAGTYGVKTFEPIYINCEDVGDAGCDKVYYTLDGSDPTLASFVYDLGSPVDLSSLSVEGEDQIDEIFTLKFYAVDAAGNVESAINSVDYILDLIPPEVTVSNDGGMFTRAFDVALSCVDCVAIYYTRDGSLPFKEGTLDSLVPLPSDNAEIYIDGVTIAEPTILRILSFDEVGNVTAGIGGIYIFTDPNPEQRTGFGSVDPLLLMWALMLLLYRQRGRFISQPRSTNV